MLIYPYHLPYAPDLSARQRDGIDCVYCPGGADGPMSPVGRLYGVLLFAHTDCAAAHRMEPLQGDAS